MDAPPLRVHPGGVYLSFHVITSANKDSIRYVDGVLKVKVTAAPEDGKANRAVLKLLKPLLGVCELTSGAKSRNKTVHIPNVSLDGVKAVLESLRGSRGL